MDAHEFDLIVSNQGGKESNDIITSLSSSIAKVHLP